MKKFTGRVIGTHEWVTGQLLRHDEGNTFIITDSNGMIVKEVIPGTVKLIDNWVDLENPDQLSLGDKVKNKETGITYYVGLIPDDIEFSIDDPENWQVEEV